MVILLFALAVFGQAAAKYNYTVTLKTAAIESTGGELNLTVTMEGKGGNQITHVLHRETLALARRQSNGRNHGNSGSQGSGSGNYNDQEESTTSSTATVSWCEYADSYLYTYSSGISSYDDLASAQAACLERDDCGGITQEPYSGDRYTLRVGTDLHEGVSPSDEISWVTCDAVDVSTSSNAWRDDGRCGSSYPNDAGEAGECNPADVNGYTCCSSYNWCGNSSAHCDCASCVDYADNSESGSEESNSAQSNSTHCEPQYYASLDTPHGISSPDYPNEYANNHDDCVSVITAESGQQIRLNFSVFEVEYHSSCSYDYLEIRDGDNGNSTLLGKYCGTTSPGTIESSGNALYINFHSDSSVTHTGYYATFTSYLDDASCAPAYNASSEKSQAISSPDYPNEYANNHDDCVSVITAESGQQIRLNFSNFELESHSSCSYDYLEIRDGDNANSTLLGKYCGNTSPGTIESSGNALYINFHSDGSVTEEGYYATFIAFGGESVGRFTLFTADDSDEEEVEEDDGVDGFTSGSTYIFNLENDIYLGTLLYVNISSGTDNAWQLDWMMVETEGLPGITRYVYNTETQWLSTDTSDENSTAVDHMQLKVQGTETYYLIMETADNNNASSDNLNLKATIHGKNGDTTTGYLDNEDRDDFVVGENDVFIVPGMEAVGKVTCITLQCSGDDDWEFDWIVVFSIKSYSLPPRVFWNNETVLSSDSSEGVTEYYVCKDDNVYGSDLV